MIELIKHLIAKTDFMRTFVGVAFVFLFMFSVIYVLTNNVPKDNTEIIHFAMGEVSGIALAIGTYYFGSSKGSQEKQDIINKHNERHNP